MFQKHCFWKITFGNPFLLKLLFSSYPRREVLLNLLERYTCLQFMYEVKLWNMNFFISSMEDINLNVLEWFDDLLQQRGLIITEDRSIAGEWRSTDDLLVHWNSSEIVMAEWAFPLKCLVWSFHFMAENIHETKGFTTLSPVYNYLIKIIG